jgi:hypothetical protein
VSCERSEAVGTVDLHPFPAALLRAGAVFRISVGRTDLGCGDAGCAFCSGDGSPLCGIGSALLCSWLLQLEPEERHSGGYGYNALLCGLGIGHSCAGVSALALAVLCGALCALLTAALRASLGRLTLPLLSIPFILVYHMVLAIVGPAGIAAPPVTDVVISDGPALLRGLGALFFLPRAEVGALVLLALLVHSRSRRSWRWLALSSPMRWESDSWDWHRKPWS